MHKALALAIQSWENMDTVAFDCICKQPLLYLISHLCKILRIRNLQIVIQSIHERNMQCIISRVQ